MWSEYTYREMQDPSLATELLAHSLWVGSLLPLFGAGISLPLGLPNWERLVELTAALVIIEPESLDSDPMRAMSDIQRIVDNARFLDAVRQGLYGQPIDSEAWDAEIRRSPLLTAIGALVMSSARGSSTEVITLNLDDVLEYYLFLHGFSSQVVVDMPVDHYRQADVRTYHVHGFLPLHNELFPDSQRVVLTFSDYVDALAETDSSPWNAFLFSRLHSKLLFAVGTSLRDFDISVVLKKALPVVAGRRPLGFILQEDDSRANEFRSRGLVQVSVSNDDVPEFILAVCRRAARINADLVGRGHE
jgi:hypothetical protein